MNFFSIRSCMLLLFTAKIISAFTPQELFYGCHSIKGCYAPDDPARDSDADCIEEVNCKHLMTWRRGDENHVVIELFAETKGWFGLGLSTDALMGNDYVIVCHRSKDDHENRRSLMHDGWNLPRKNLMIGEITDKHGWIEIQETTATEKAVYCKFKLKIKFTVIDPFEKASHPFDLYKEYCPILAWGDVFVPPNSLTNPFQRYQPGAHSKGNFGSYFSCRNKSTMATRLHPSHQEVAYLKYHGILMIISWVFCISVGNFIGTFYNDYHVKKKCCKGRVCLWLHCSFVLLALFPMIVATYFQVQGQKDWNSIEKTQKFHRIGGYILEAIYFLSIFTGLFVRKKITALRDSLTTDRVNITDFLHKVISHFSHLLAAIIIAETPKIPFSTMSCTLGLTTMLWIILYFTLNVFMSFHRFWAPYAYVVKSYEDDKNKGDDFDANSLHSQTAINYGPDVRSSALRFFAVLMLLCAIILSVLVYWPPIGPCHKSEIELKRLTKLVETTQEMLAVLASKENASTFDFNRNSSKKTIKFVHGLDFF